MESDLLTLSRRGYRIVPLTILVDVLRGNLPKSVIENKRLVAITFDDGWDFDVHDWESEKFGMVPRFQTLLQRSDSFLEQLGDGPKAVSFVIASPQAREILTVECGNGPGSWGDDWWEKIAKEGIIGIGNHGWDHVHECLPTVRQRNNKKGSFFEIDTFDDAQGQIADAQKYIARATNEAHTPIFGYPYGHVPQYLRDEYFPQNGDQLGIKAAFGTEGRAVDPSANIWDLPRFVCGWHWKSPEDFDALLDSVERGER